jgi:hypothetical protein
MSEGTGRKAVARERRRREFEHEVASRAEDLQMLQDDGGLLPYVSEDGSVVTVTAIEGQKWEGGQKPWFADCVAELQREATTEGGRRVMAAAYKLYQGLGDLREDTPND